MAQYLSSIRSAIRQWLMVAVLAIMPLIGFSAVPVHAQTPSHDQVATISVDGVVQSIDGDTWTVSGVAIHVTADTTVSGTPTIGSTIHVLAVSDNHNRIVAQSISVIPVTVTVITATPGPSLTPTITNTPGTITPTVTPAVSPTGIPYVTVIIEGPVETITVNVIVVYGQKIKLRGDDPTLVKLKIGDWVRISGNRGVDDDNVTVVVIAVVIVIIDTPPVIIVQQPGPGGGNGDNGGDDDGHGPPPKHKDH